MRTVVIANPRASGHCRNPNLIRDYARCGPTVEVLQSRSLDELDELCVGIAAAPPELLAISGGDGTISLTLSGLTRAFGGQALPPVLPLAAGTMNMVARSVGVGPPLKELRRAAAGRAGIVVERDTLRCEDRLGFLFGFGLVTNFLAVYYRGPGRGPLKAAQVLGRAIMSVIKRGPAFQEIFRRQAGHLTIDNNDLGDHPWTAVLVLSIENLGLGFRPGYRALERPGSFHVLATAMSPVDLVNHIDYIRRGRPWPTPEMHDRIATRIELRTSGDVLYTLDGELYSASKHVQVVAGPRIHFVRTHG